MAPYTVLTDHAAHRAAERGIESAEVEAIMARTEAALAAFGGMPVKIKVNGIVVAAKCADDNGALVAVTAWKDEKPKSKKKSRGLARLYREAAREEEIFGF